MPTRNRKGFVLQSIEYFKKQNYSPRELVILDGGDENLADSTGLGEDTRIHYIHARSTLPIGESRNRLCEQAKGSIVAHWDDDDWYGFSRLTAQITPLLDGSADITAFSDCLFLDIERYHFWRCDPSLFRRMFVGKVHAGTLVYWRSLFEQGIRFPETSNAEDAHFLCRCHDQGAKVEGISGQDRFIYVRHSQSGWRFRCGEYIDRRGWSRAAPPNLPREDAMFFQSQAYAQQKQSLLLHEALMTVKNT